MITPHSHRGVGAPRLRDEETLGVSQRGGYRRVREGTAYSDA